MKTKFICENCKQEVTDSQKHCGNCGSQLSDQIPMFKVDKEKNQIKFINIATMKEFIASGKINESFYKVKDKEKAIIEFINYAQLKKAEEYLSKIY